jgi:hypothetical protein
MATVAPGRGNPLATSEIVPLIVCLRVCSGCAQATTTLKRARKVRRVLSFMCLYFVRYIHMTTKGRLYPYWKGEKS